ncbi:hypothetical protein R5R35_009548 [Gryllus longicercus]|uniref:Cyclin E n=1 Tax=Gryllus longicercus TaxID=2509291 RepID=A0AAN9VKI0_9ORTH
MRPPSHYTGRPSLLKRKRTYSDDEDMQNDSTVLEQAQHQPSAQACVPSADVGELDPADVLLSPDSEPQSEWYSEGTPSDELTVSDAGESTSAQEATSHSSGDDPLNARLAPMPRLSWADAQQVWELMCQKDEACYGERDEDVFLRHPGLTPRMRSILLDWLIEVCDVYKLHRQTYHLCLDYIDRYLSRQSNIPKQQLQLIGITSLFIASKVEEIYPPKIREFAYVTDGACTEEEIMDKELIILKALDWNLSPVTAHSWLTMYLQMLSNVQQQEEGAEDTGDTFVFPQFSGQTFMLVCQLLDLCMLDDGSMRFPYAALAAGAIYHVCSKEMALFVTEGLQWFDITSCVLWMKPFAEVLREGNPIDGTSLRAVASWQNSNCALSRTVPRIVSDDAHNIQMHSIDLRLLERAQQRLLAQQQTALCIEESPVAVAPGLLTPPASSKKSSSASAAYS